jgi:hypothetical protein
MDRPHFYRLGNAMLLQYPLEQRSLWLEGRNNRDDVL